MNVRIILDTPALSGIGKYVRDISEALENNVEIYTLLFEGIDHRSNYLGKTYTGRLQLPFTSGWYLNSHFQGFAFRHFYNEIISTDQADTIYHYADYSINPRTPIERSVLTIHDFFRVKDVYREKYGYGNLRYIRRNMEKYRRFENILAISETVKNEAIEWGTENVPTVIYPPVARYFRPLDNKLALRVKYGLPADKILILSVSTDDPRKNLRTVIKVAKHLGEKYSLVRVGTAVEGAYNFTNLSGDQINEIYNACDLLLFPTLDEGFGYPLVEAMSVGLPVVSSDIAVVREIAGGAAVLVQPDVKGCLNGIKELMSDRDLFVRKGLERSRLFSFDSFSANIRKYYQRLSKDRHPLGK
ncbi:MAG TPA: glycosyltransferase family 1 protein [Thermoplasmataceae archaeon]|nr:glycosyltransferase family 1 protein [Thermoplasmataceae archaeon]